MYPHPHPYPHPQRVRLERLWRQQKRARTQEQIEREREEVVRVFDEARTRLQALQDHEWTAAVINVVLNGSVVDCGRVSGAFDEALMAQSRAYMALAQLVATSGEEALSGTAIRKVGRGGGV